MSIVGRYIAALTTGELGDLRRKRTIATAELQASKTVDPNNRDSRGPKSSGVTMS